jgi:hypothetical protein
VRLTLPETTRFGGDRPAAFGVGLDDVGVRKHDRQAQAIWSRQRSAPATDHAGVDPAVDPVEHRSEDSEVSEVSADGVARRRRRTTVLPSGTRRMAGLLSKLAPGPRTADTRAVPLPHHSTSTASIDFLGRPERWSRRRAPGRLLSQQRERWA